MKFLALRLLCIFYVECFEALEYSTVYIFYYFLVPGEVPGLYSPEELEPLLSSLKDAASQDGFTRPLYDYFSYSKYSLTV